VNVWHEAEAIHLKDPVYGEGDFLIAEDEFAGAEGTAQCPNGGVHVYDITGDKETHPVPVGAFNIDQAGVAPGNDPADAYVARCTAHVFQIDHRSKLMTMGWYNAGVRVIDLRALVGVAAGNTGVAGMRQIGWYASPTPTRGRPRPPTPAARATTSSATTSAAASTSTASRHRPRRRRPACG